MTSTVLLIALAAAVLHAGRNAMVKGAADHVTTMGLIALGHVIPAIALIFLLPLPALAAFPYIIASTIIHWVYY